MNEEQLADILAEQLDALLAGRSLPEGSPGEIVDLLPVAQHMVETAPVPRPEFGPALKQSLLGPGAGGNGTTGSVGSTFKAHWFLFVVGGLLVLAAALTLFVGIFIFDATRSVILGDSSPTASPISPAQPALPHLLSTPTAESTPTRSTSDPLPPPAPTATLILDQLPAITITVQTADDPAAVPNLVPGQSTSGDGEDGGGSGGDHNRGHGNDPDHHDHDNPGRRGNDDD